MKHFLLLTLLCALPVFSSYVEDSVAVRSILDKNGLSSIAVSDVSDSTDGRIIALYLSSLSLKTIPDCIGTLTELRMLKIEKNGLQQLPKTIVSCKRLHEINCSFNKLSSFLSSKDTLPEIYSANFDNNNFISIPEALLRSSTLQQLSMKNNKVVDISNAIACTTLTYLYLDNNSIRSLPQAFGSLTNLEVFAVNGNQLNFLPVSIGQCQRLRKLDCTANRIKALPEELFACRKMTDLYISSNNVLKIPVQIGMMDSLRWVFADNNSLSALPEAISDLVQLQWLSAAGNDLHALPSVIGKLKQLTTMNISSNKISELPVEFINLHNLTTLNLSNNLLTTLPPGIDSLQQFIFKRAGKEYSTLNISNNNLCSLEPAQKAWADKFAAGWEKTQRCGR